MGLFQLPGTDGGPPVKRPKIVDFENMLVRDSQTAGLEAVITLPILATSPRIEKHDDDTGEAELARKVLLDPPHEGGMKTPMNLVLQQAVTAFTLRQACWEIVWEKKGGDIVVDKLAFRRPSTCFVKDYDGKLGFRQEGFTKDGKEFKKDFEPLKSMVYLHGISAMKPTEGRSAFEAGYQDYFNKQKLKLLHFMYLQKFSIPPLVVTVDSFNDEDHERALRKGEAVKAGATIVKSPIEHYETLTAAQTVGGAQGGSADFRETFRYLDAQMAISMLVQFLMLGTASEKGSFALSRDHSDLFLLSEEARQYSIVDVIQQQVLAELIFQNFGEKAAMPQFKMTALSQEHEAMALDLLKAVFATQDQIGLSPPELSLVKRKAFSRLDISQDQIQAAEEEAEEEQKKAGGSSAGGGLQGAIQGLFGGVQPQPQQNGNGSSPPGSAQAAPAQNGSGSSAVAAGSVLDAIQELGAIDIPFDPSVTAAEVELYNTTVNQQRDFHGRFAPSGGASKQSGGKSAGGGGGGGRAAGGGSAIGSTRKAPPPLPTPAKKGQQNNAAPQSTQLKSGEQVNVTNAPPAQPHFVIGGLRGGQPYALFFDELVNNRLLTPQEVEYVTQYAAVGFDGSSVNVIGRFNGQQLVLQPLGNPQPGVVEYINGLYGTPQPAPQQPAPQAPGQQPAQQGGAPAAQ